VQVFLDETFSEGEPTEVDIGMRTDLNLGILEVIDLTFAVPR
jgi:hypothetical protein